MTPLLLVTAMSALLSAGVALAQPLKCQDPIDQELSRAGLTDVVKSIRPIDQSAFVRNGVGQYPAYLLVDDVASKALVGELILSHRQDEIPANEMITLSAQGSPKMVLFTKSKRIVGYSSSLLAQGAGKAVLLSSQCEPVSVHVTLPAVSPPYLTPVIALNRSDCSHLSELMYLAKDVEIKESESLFDGICRVRGGTVYPNHHTIDDDLACECPNGEVIQPELEKWSGPGRTCFNSAHLSYADQFASLISSKSSFVNGGFQALASQLRNPGSVIAQQCRLYFD